MVVTCQKQGSRENFRVTRKMKLTFAQSPLALLKVESAHFCAKNRPNWLALSAGGNGIKIGLPGKSKVLKVMFWEVPPAGGPLL